MGKRGQGTTGLLCPKTEEEWLTMLTQVCDGEGGDGDENGHAWRPRLGFGDGCDMFDDQGGDVDDQDHDDQSLVYGDVSEGDVNQQS